jgi:hypothetical protein
MNMNPTVVNNWYEPQLFDSEALEISLRVGLVVGAGHGQIQIEVWDATSGSLVGMESVHHVDLSVLAMLLPVWVEKFSQAVESRIDPF